MNKAIFLIVIAALLMASCNLDGDDNYGGAGGVAPPPAALPPPPPPLNTQFEFNLRAWAEQEILNYSFDVHGFEYETDVVFYAAKDAPQDAIFYARVTVENGEIVSIENLEPGQRSPGVNGRV